MRLCEFSERIEIPLVPLASAERVSLCVKQLAVRCKKLLYFFPHGQLPFTSPPSRPPFLCSIGETRL